MKKKLVSVLLAAVMVTGIVAGCAKSEEGGSSEGKKYDGVELTYWSMWANTEPQGKVLQEAADAWEEETGGKVNIEWKGRDVKQILSSSLEAEEDIDLFEDDYKRIAEIYVDYVYDLTDMAEKSGYADQSFAMFNERATEWAGFLPCISEQPNVGGVYYNQDLFEQAGVEVPKTWSEFLQVCQTLKDNNIQPLALDSTYATFLFGYHLARYIGEDAIANMAVEGKWSENPLVAQAAQDMIDFVKAGYLADGAPAEYPASQDAIGLDGDVAMVVCANYVTSEVNNHSGTEVNWSVFNYPSVEGAAEGVDQNAAYAGANSIAITKYSKNPEAAFDFARFVTSGEYDQKMADTASQIPADPSNKAPSSQNGTIELLNSVQTPLSWNMGFNQNADLMSPIAEVIVKLYEGNFSTGEEFVAALDALY